MLLNQGPRTSLTEDLREFNLLSESEPSTSPPQTKEPDAKGGDYAGPPGSKDAEKDEPGDEVNVGDAAAGHRTNVPSRGDTTDAGTSVAESDDEDEKDDDDDDEDDADDGKTESVSTKRRPKFFEAIASVAEQEEAQQAEQQAEQLQQEQFEKAHALYMAYYSEDADGLDDTGLRSVIEAQSVMIDHFNEALDAANSYIAEMEKEKAEKDDEDKADDDGDSADDKKAAFLAKIGKKPQAESVRFSAAAGGREQHNASLGEQVTDLFQDLQRLEQGVLSEDTDEDAYAEAQKVVEGLERVRDTCLDICEGIVDVIRTTQGVAEGEEVELDPQDDRVQIGAHFESIQNDAVRILEALADEGCTYNFEQASEDLNKLATDMEQGIERMKKVG